jgi:hypothetical protein
MFFLKLPEESHLINYIGVMPRLARLEAPGVLHHAMGRGIGGNLSGSFGKNVPLVSQSLEKRSQNPIQLSKSNHHGKMEAFDRTKSLH